MRIRLCARVIFASCFLVVFLYKEGHTQQTDERARVKEQVLSLEEIRAYALANSPLVKEIDREFASQLSSALDTELLQNPQVSLENRFPRSRGSSASTSETTATFEQPMRLSNFGTRSAVANLIKRAGNVSQKAALFELNQRIRLLYIRLWSLQETRRLLEGARQRSSAKVRLVREAVSKGLLALGDKRLFEGETYRLESEVLGLSSTIALTQNELILLTALPKSNMRAVRFSLAPIPSIASLLKKAQESEISQGSRIDILTGLAKEQVRLAEFDSFPQFAPRLVYERTADGTDFFGFGFSIGLPFWNQNQPAIVKARGELEAVEAKRKFLNNDGMKRQIESLQTALETARKQAELFEQKVVPAFASALKLQEEQFQKGKGNVLQVWQSLRAFNEVQEQALQLWIQSFSASVQLSILIGEEV